MFSKILLVVPTILFSQGTLAAKEIGTPAEIAGETEVFIVSNVAATNEAKGAKRPLVEFSLMSSTYLAGKATRGRYCNMFKVKGLFSAEAATAVRDTLVRAKKVQVDSKNFVTSRSQEMHNGAVAAKQERYLAQKHDKTGLAAPDASRCYTYDIDAGNIAIITENGTTTTADAEAKKNNPGLKTENPEVALKFLRADLKEEEKNLQDTRKDLKKTFGKDAKENLKKSIQESEAKIAELKKDISTRTQASAKAPSLNK